MITYEKYIATPKTHLNDLNYQPNAQLADQCCVFWLSTHHSTARVSSVAAGPSNQRLPSRDIPTARHFCKRQCWQRFRLVLSIRQFFCRGHEYVALLC